MYDQKISKYRLRWRYATDKRAFLLSVAEDFFNTVPLWITIGIVMLIHTQTDAIFTVSTKFSDVMVDLLAIALIYGAAILLMKGIVALLPRSKPIPSEKYID